MFAHLYGRLARMGNEPGWGRAHREELLAGVAGRVLEVGAGSGLCFGHYPARVTEVVATEESVIRFAGQRMPDCRPPHPPDQGRRSPLQ